MRGRRRRGGAIGNPSTQVRRHDRLAREMFIREEAEGEEKDKDIRRGESWRLMDRTPLVLIRLARIWVGGNRWTILGPCQTLALVHTAATTLPAQGGQFCTTGGRNHGR